MCMQSGAGQGHHTIWINKCAPNANWMRENGIYASPTLGFDWESAPRSSLFCFFFFFYFIPWPHWGIVWFNSGLALIYICGRIILQLLKIMSAVRRLNQGQRQLPPSMASFHFMDIYFVFGPTKWPAVCFFCFYFTFQSCCFFFTMFLCYVGALGDFVHFD